MSDAFAPKLSGGIGFEQPVTAPSLAGDLAGLGRLVLSSRKEQPKPSAADVKGSSLRPFNARLEELRNSNLSDQNFLKEARKLGRQYTVALPQYQSDISTSLEGYGVTAPADILNPRDIQIENITKWSQETTEGNLALMQSQVTDASGQIDMESTLQNIEVKYQEDLAQRATIEQTNRDMKLIQNDENTWKIQSRNKIQPMVITWTKTSKDLTDSLIGLVSSGDPSVDTYDEQMGFLREQRRVLYNKFTSDAQSSGIHSSVYSGEGSSNILEALKPIDSMIAMGENMVTDQENAFKAWENIQKRGLTEQATKSLSPYFVFPEFQRALFPYLAQDVYGDGEKLSSFLKGIEAQTSVGGLSIIQGSITVEDARVAADVQEKDGTPVKADIVTSATETLNAADPAASSPEDAAKTANHSFKMLRVANSLLGSSTLGQVYNPTAVKNVKAIIAKNDENGQEVRGEYLTFAAEQLQMNAKSIESNLAATEGYSVRKEGGVLHLYLDDTRLDSGSLSVGNSKGRNILKAVNNINTINKNSIQILGIEEEKVPVLLPHSYEDNIEDIKEYLNGTSTIQGGEGEDTLGATPTVSSSGATPMLLNLMDANEGGGDYDTLFGHSQREGGQFSGTKVSQMTIGDLLSFSGDRSEGSYGKWVQSKNPKGALATPMGRYQFVGTTLKQVAKEMGLHNNIRFTPEVQDAMFHHLAKKSLAGKTSDAAKRKAMRGTWDGFNHVSDRELDAAIADFEGRPVPAYTELQGSTGVSQTGPRPQARPDDLDTSIGTDRVRPVTRPESPSETRTEGVESVRDVTPTRGVKRGSQAAKAIWGILAQEAKARLIAQFGDEALAEEAIANGEVALEDIM